MKQLLFFLFLTFSFVGKSQITGRSMYFSKIGWRIDIPAGYKISDTLSPKNFLFSIVDDRVNFLGAYLIPFDSKRDGDWPVFVRSSNKKEYDMGKYEGVQSDSVSGEETISGNR